MSSLSTRKIDPHVPEWPSETAWFRFPKHFYRWIPKYASRTVAKLPFRPLPLINVQIGGECRVRGFAVTTVYDRWVDGRVVEIQANFKFPDRTVSDRIIVQFIDPISNAACTGTFCNKWGEVCGVGQEHHFPPMTKEVFIDMVQTRVMYTPIMTKSRQIPGPSFATRRAVWIPAWIEDYTTDATGAPHLDVRFVHFLGGLNSASPPLKVRTFLYLYGFEHCGRGEEFIDSVLNEGQAGSRLEAFSQDDMQRAVETWGEAVSPRISDYRNLPKFFCTCGIACKRA